MAIEAWRQVEWTLDCRIQKKPVRRDTIRRGIGAGEVNLPGGNRQRSGQESIRTDCPNGVWDWYESSAKCVRLLKGDGKCL